jgi:hypothetical protein
MRHVPHLVALADPDDVAEIVGDDAQVVAVVVDVGREERAVAPAQDDLLAPVRVVVRPRPGVYGLDLTTSVPLGEGASVIFKYARYFSAPARARAAYGSDVMYERALVVAQVLPGGAQLSLLPSTRPVADNLVAPLSEAGTYVVAAAK